MALVSRTKYGGMINFAEDSSSPSGSVALYAKSAGNGDNEHLVAHAPTASFTGDIHVTGALNIEKSATIDINLTVKDDTVLGEGTLDTTTVNGLAFFNENTIFYKDLTIGDASGADVCLVNAQMTASNGLLASAGLNSTTMSASSNLQVGGTADFDGAVSMDKTLSAAGNVTFDRNLTVKDDTVLGEGTLDTTTVNGLAFFYEDTIFYKDLTIGDTSGDDICLVNAQMTASNGALFSAGLNSTTMSASSNLSVGGTSDFDGAVTMDNNLAVAGNVTLGDSASDTVTINGTVGSFTAGTITATELVATSDARLKSNIQDVTNAMDVINSIQGVEYDLIETGEHSMGVLAQELIQVAPALVKTRENGNYAVNYSGLSAFFVEAFKEQQSQIKDQKEQIEELKTMVKELASK